MDEGLWDLSFERRNHSKVIVKLTLTTTVEDIRHPHMMFEVLRAMKTKVELLLVATPCGLLGR
jgi:hypothetical protein